MPTASTALSRGNKTVFLDKVVEHGKIQKSTSLNTTTYHKITALHDAKCTILNFEF